MKKNITKSLIVALAVPFLSQLGCGKRDGGGEGGESTNIQNKGSDTMLQLAQAWSEMYSAKNPDVRVAVSGGGSGTGIAGLINGVVDVANCSRSIKPTEEKEIEAKHGVKPKEYIMGLDCLAVFVHKDNPMEEITIEQLGQIFGEDGTITKWSQLGIEVPGDKDEIVRVSRTSNSGTYVYFKETVIPEGKSFKSGALGMHGSKEVVELCGKTEAAIGFSGMGYATDEVKMLLVSQKEGAEAFAPNNENALSGNYPIARPLFMYTLGEPKPHVKAYLDWCMGPEGQKIVAATGYVPNKQK
ncbi:MAG: phosphate ABC transporter substrate-binding protein [Verrucomicrobia subdivision 3 bacterium]|nr:phosphate ABC transporter substrate-binding protein [Limisphaerales bacterium]